MTTFKFKERIMMIKDVNKSRSSLLFSLATWLTPKKYGGLRVGITNAALNESLFA